MDDDAIVNDFQAELWSDWKPESSFPTVRPLLAHYTSVQVFEKIVRTNQLWFSNPLLMNDWEEMNFGIKEGRAEFHKSEELKNACGDGARYQTLLKSFEDCFYSYDFEHVLNTYVLCFSQHEGDEVDGKLSMWRGYGNEGAGVAVVFDTGNLHPNNDSPLIVGQVTYASTKERLDWIKGKVAAYASFLDRHALNDEQLFYATRIWFERLKLFSLFTKHSGFREENEWRIVYMNDRDPNNSFSKYFGHIATDRGIEPRLMLPVEPIAEYAKDVSLENLVCRIIVGPSIANELGLRALKQMLSLSGRTQLADMVILSSIPFRKLK